VSVLPRSGPERPPLTSRDNLIAITGVAALLGQRAAVQLEADSIPDMGIDACIMLRPSEYQTGFGGMKSSLLKMEMMVEYIGSTSHEGVAPCESDPQFVSMLLSEGAA
jgi:hypothetical protein